MTTDDMNKANELLKFFSTQDLSYSLKPKKIDLEHPLDSFLFDSKVGYCVHFASSFATAARMIGLPSRIVTGYKADRSNAINNYILIKEADAHAWVEIYIQDQGWVRFEPTSTASRVLTPSNPQLSNAYTNASLRLSTMQKLFKQANIYYMYTRYVINTWVIQYSRIKQMSLLKDLLTNTMFLLKFIASIVGFIMLVIVSFVLLQRRQCSDLVLCEMQGVLKSLKKEGFQRERGETMFDFLRRAEKNTKYSDLIEEINRLYHLYKYAKDQGDEVLERLHSKSLELKKAIKNG
ncbi:transglutaminase family protein [Campylobacterota bacterium]